MRSRMQPAGWAGALLLLFSGCASAWNGSGKEPISGPQSASSTDKGATARTKTRSTAGAKPRRTPPRPGPAVDTDVVTADVDPGRATISRPPGRDAVRPAGGLFSPRKPATKGKPVDPAAAAVVDQEFPDASREEKQGILADLEGMSPANMRAMLRAWKQGMARKSGTAATPGVGEAGREPMVNQTAATEESTTTRIKKSLSAGLGSVTAWGTAIVGGKKQEPVPAPPAAPLTTPSAQIEEIASTTGDEDVGRATARDLPAVRESSSRDVLQELISVAEDELADLPSGPSIRERDEFISKHVSLRMLYLVGGRHELAMQAIPEIDPIDQEFWQHLFWGLANYFDTESLPAQDERAAEAAAQLTQAVLKLQRRAHLEVRFATFCDEIEGYGVYEQCAATTFHPGQEVLLYAEFGNVMSVLDEGGQYRTSHVSVIELSHYGSDADPVERIELPEAVDRCRRPRRDYYHSYLVSLPTDMSPGAYVLKLLVTDLASRRQASHTLNFRVVAGPAVAAPPAETETVSSTQESVESVPTPTPTPSTVLRAVQTRMSPRAPDIDVDLDLPAVDPGSVDESPADEETERSESDEAPAMDAPSELTDEPAAESTEEIEAEEEDLPPLPPVG